MAWRTFVAQRAQGIEVVAENLHGDVRPGAGEHVVDAVGNRLSDGDVHPGNEREIPPEGLKKGGFPALAHDQGHIELGGFHPLGVLVELGPSGAPGDGDHLGMRQ